METISERIKFAMNIKDMKQAELVQKTGITKGAFSSYLSGRYYPKKDKLELIADALGVDIEWLAGKNVPMQKATCMPNNELESEPLPEYVFYKNADTEYLLDGIDDVYMGLMNESTALVPRFYVLVNTSLNEMHILPLFLRKDSHRFYECPAELFDSPLPSIFTKDFDSIKMVLSTSMIYYYGIDTEIYAPTVEVLSYSQNKGHYEPTEDYPAVPVEEFLREVQKEALYLKEKNQ